MTMRILATRHVHASGSHAGTRLQGQELAVEKLDAKVHNNKGRYFENPAVDHEEAVATLGYKEFKRPRTERLGTHTNAPAQPRGGWS